MPFGLFWKKRPFSPDLYKVSAEDYREDYEALRRQPASVLRQLKTVKIVMASCIPLFFAASAFSTRFAIVLGCVSGIPLFSAFLKGRRNAKAAAAVPVSIITGIAFGFWFRRRLGL
jgi:hypothetical protein